MDFKAFLPVLVAIMPLLAPVVTQLVKMASAKTIGKIPSALKPVVNVGIGAILAGFGDVVSPVTGAIAALTAGKVYEVNKAQK
jgi:hypothetical protein